MVFVAGGRTDLSRRLYKQGVDSTEIWVGCGPLRGVLEEREKGCSGGGLEYTSHPLGERLQ